MQNPLSSDATFYKQLFERTHTINLIIDFETGQIVEANPAACTFYGYGCEQLTAKRLTDINVMPESDIRAVMGRVVSGEHVTFQTQHRVANGTIVDVEVFASSIERDSKTYLYGIVTDITAQKQSEKALRQSEATYRLFAQNMPDSSVVMFDTDMRHTLTEGPFLKTFGPLYKSLLGKTPQEALPKALADSIVPVYQRVLKGEAFNYERITETYAYESFVTPIRDESSTIIGGMILSHDISERHFVTIALRDSETRYESVISAMSEGVVVHGQDGRIQACNMAAERMLGLTADQLMGRTAIDARWRAIHEDGSRFLGDMHPAMVTLKTGQPLTHVIMGVHKPDDLLVWISVNSRPLIQPDETVPYAVVTTFTDITERKRLDDALLASKNMLTQVIENIPFRVFWKDEQSIYRGCNTLHAHAKGMTSADDIVGKTDHDLLSERATEWAADDRMIMASGKPKLNIEELMVDSDGSSHWLRSNKVPLHDNEGTIKGVLATIEDITERKRLEDALRSSEAQLRLISDHMQDFVTENDTKGRMTFVSASAQTMLGYRPDSLLGTSSADLIHPDDRKQLAETFRASLENGASQFRLEARLRHADGSYIPTETIGRFITDKQSNPISGVFVTRDITERKHLQEVLIRQETMQAELNKETELSNLKSRMMERIAHEFRTPLTIIQVYTETLTGYYERLTPEKREQKVKGIKDQIRHITDMLDEIGLVVKGDFTPDTLNRVSTNFSGLCGEIAVEVAKYFNLPDVFVLDVPEIIRIDADPEVLGNALFHIMRNAVRFSNPEEAVTIKVLPEESGITLQVTDRGIGILPAELPRVFDPFFRGTNINERSGLGVGLTIARAGIEAHNGTITINSVVGQGTTVKIWLPLS